jgi:hypothetical protein
VALLVGRDNPRAVAAAAVSSEPHLAPTSLADVTLHFGPGGPSTATLGGLVRPNEGKPPSGPSGPSGLAGKPFSGAAVAMGAVGAAANKSHPAFAFDIDSARMRAPTITATTTATAAAVAVAGKGAPRLLLTPQAAARSARGTTAAAVSGAGVGAAAGPDKAPAVVATAGGLQLLGSPSKTKLLIIPKVRLDMPSSNAFTPRGLVVLFALDCISQLLFG